MRGGRFEGAANSPDLIALLVAKESLMRPHDIAAAAEFTPRMVSFENRLGV
jgi:hypothetical protein